MGRIAQLFESGVINYVITELRRLRSNSDADAEVI
jgi:hypothetical protein